MVSQPFIVRFGKNITSFLADAFVIVISLPICALLEKPAKKLRTEDDKNNKEVQKMENVVRPKYYEYILYSSSNYYEDETIKITFYEEQITLHEHTSEHAPGESYGLIHVLDKENAEKLKKCFEVEEISDYERVADHFKGENAVKLFEDFCEKNSIKIVCYAG